MLLDLLSIAAGLLCLMVGGDWLVGGASRIALLARVPPAVVGLTVVAAGTSMPELVVSLQAAYNGTPDMAVGNVVGSTFYNITLIVGVAAMVGPLTVRGETVRMEWPVMALAACSVYVLGHDGAIDRTDGGFLVLSLVVFIAWTVRLATRTGPEEKGALEDRALEASTDSGRVWAKAIGRVLIGSAGLAFGAKFLVGGAASIASVAGISDRVIGLTVVAIGTGMPELVTSVVASARGQSDIAIANVVGSNIFNVLAILGMTSVITPLPINPAILSNDVWWMIGAAFALFPLMYSGRVVNRWEGALLFIGAVVYTVLLII